MSDEITALHDKLREGAALLSTMIQDLERESELLPYDWEIQERLQSTGFYGRSVERAVTLVLRDPVASKDMACLRELDDKVLCVGQTIGIAMLSILAQLTAAHEKVDPVIRGAWAMDEQLPVAGNLRVRLSALIQSVGFCRGHILQMRMPELYPWKKRKTAEEITLLTDAAQAVETELTGLLSGSGTTIDYGWYLQLETILASYEYFEAYALKKGRAH